MARAARAALELHELNASVQRIGVDSRPNHPQNYRVQQTLNAGQSCIAQHDIPKGSYILKEEKMFSVRLTRYVRRPQAIDDAVAALSTGYRRSFRQLACAGADNNENRFNTNNFDMGKSEYGVFFRASRFNHSCIPNAGLTQQGQLIVFAIQDIPSDQEITICYLQNHYLTSSERDGQLWPRYAFHCRCTACTTDHQESDFRRKLMANYQSWLECNKPVNQSQQALFDYQNITGAFVWELQIEGLTYPEGNLCMLFSISLEERMNGLTPETMGIKNGRLRETVISWRKRALDILVMTTGTESSETRRALSRLVDLL